MKRVIYTYGIIAGAIELAMMIIITAFKDSIPFEAGMYIGYTTMILAFSLIFFAIQSYKKAHGAISFKKSMYIGLGITAVCSIIYVAAWMIIYYNFMPHYLDNYTDHYIQNMKAAGTPQAEIDAAIKEMNGYKELYKSPFNVIWLTLIEILPVGLIVSLIAALVERLRTKPKPVKTV